MTKPTDSRELALDILIEIIEHGGYSHIILKQALDKYSYLEKQDRAFITRIVDGTLEYLIQTDYVINLFSKTKINKMKPVIRTILRMSVYQILYMDRIPDSAVCNEAVKLAEKRHFTGLKGFVNGVLRNIVRSKESITWPNTAIRYSLPDWLVDMWNMQYKEDMVKKAGASFLENRPISVRCNNTVADTSKIIDSLKSQGIKVSKSKILNNMLYMEHIDSMETIDAFNKGYIQVQDVSSALVAEAAFPKHGDYVIDVCGAPGGKSLNIADKLSGTGMVDVRDISEYKVSLIDDNIRRCGFTNIKSKIWDALIPDKESYNKADIVIADLPCSGLGIIGKKPDIKIRMNEDKIVELVKLQKDILSVIQNYVKPGGTLVYSTCTVNKRENDEQAEWFIRNFSFEPINIKGRLGELTADSMEHGYIQLFPGEYDLDGFFISAFRKI